MGHPPFCSSQVLEMLESLNGEWLTFQQILLDSEQMLKKHKEKFKTGLIHAADDFKKKAHNLLEDFEFKGLPYSTALPPLVLALGTQPLKCLGEGENRRGHGPAHQKSRWAAQRREKATGQCGMSSPELWVSGWEGWAGSVLTLTSCPPPTSLRQPHTLPPSLSSLL